MIIAIAAPVLFLIVGGAIDFGRAVQLRSVLQDAVDVASVGSVAINSSAYKIALTMGSGDISQGLDQAESIFASNLPQARELSSVLMTGKISKASTLLTSNLTVTANYRPYMLSLMGVTNLPIRVTASSMSSMPPYIDFYLLLDNTPSMGLGATYADINKMIAATASAPNEQSCAFACHETGPFSVSHPATLPERYALSKSIGAIMRIDVVREATQQLMATALKTQSVPGQFRMSIYDFGQSAQSISLNAPVPYQVSALTPDLTKSALDASGIDLMTIPYQNYNTDQQTNFKSVMAYMNQPSVIANPGDGTTASTPQKVLFFVSDGMMDSYDCSQGGGCRRLGGIDVQTCTDIKSRGIRIAVLYTSYLRLKDNPQLQTQVPDKWYSQNVDPLLYPTNQVATNMQACASPGLYFEVTPSQGIPEAMTALFNKVVSVVRINS